MTEVYRSFYDPAKVWLGRTPDAGDLHSCVGSFDMSAGINGEDDWFGEWRLTFHEFGTRISDPAFRLQVFGDGVEALRRSELLDLLPDAPTTLDEFGEMLRACGWDDRTAELRGDHPVTCRTCHGTGYLDERRPS